jgi:predicted PurR-regulated permease PerM
MNSTLAPVATIKTDSAVAAEEDRPVANALVATVRMVVDARGLALGVLAALALVFALSWAQKFLVPLLLGIVIAYTLNPLVVWLEAIKIPRVAGTVIIMVSVIGALVLGTYSLRGEMQTILEQLPEAAAKVSTAIERVRIGQPGSMQKIQNAATEVEQATTQAGSVASRASLPPT